MSIIRPDNPDACISCNICLTSCPVAKASRLYRGPKLNGPALTRLRMLVDDSDDMVKYCSNCKNCDRVCPSGTSISAFNMKARATYYKTHPHDIADQILSSNEQMGKLMTSIPFISGPVANIGMKVAGLTGILDKMGVVSKAPLPKYGKTNFYTLFKKYKQPSCSKKVLFFPGCYVNYNEPELGMTLIKVYNRNNIEVIVDKSFKCCGSPMLSTGYLDKVEQNAIHNVKLLKEYVDKGIDIVTTCTTCSLFLKQEYEELFNLKEIHAYSSHVYEAMEYLLIQNKQGQMLKNFSKVETKLAYHTSCHLKVNGIGRPSLDVLKMVPGVEIEDLKAGCCGLSGIYGYKHDTAPIGDIIGKTLRGKLQDSDADLGICECNICRLQMQNNTGKKASHPLYILEKSYANSN